MVLFWCRIKQAQIRALSNCFTRYYFQIHESSSVIRQTKIGVVNGQSLTFHRTGSEFGHYVRSYAAPVQVKPKSEESYKGRPRMNEQITAQSVRLVTDEGHGVVSRHEALERARRLNVDLVEVQPDGKPPVCKLMDYNKEMYVKQVKEKELTKKKSDLVLRKGGLKEVRITYKIDKHDLQTKADTVKRLAERGYRVKCMAVRVGKEEQDLGQEKQDSDKIKQDSGKEKPNSGKGKQDSGKEKQDSGKGKQDLGGLLSRFSALINDFSLVESGPKVEAKQAYVVVRHIKFGPLKKGLGKKTGLERSKGNTSTESPEKDQILDEFDSDSEVAIESDSPDDFDHDRIIKIAPETSNRYAAARPTNGPARGSENRYATMNPTNGSGLGVKTRFDTECQSQSQSQNPGSIRQSDSNRQGLGEPASSYGMFGAPKPNSESGPVEVNRYKKGPGPQQPLSDHRGPRGDFGRENLNMNPNRVREKQGGFRR